MEKISRIIPPSSRTQSYDVARAQPARPGAPSLGRPVFEPIVDKVILSESLTKSLTDKFENGDTVSRKEALQTYAPPKETTKIDVIRKMSEDFFREKNEVPSSTVAAETTV